MKDGFLRVACATPEIKVADCENNANNIIELIEEASNNETSLIVFPELCITAYTCNDLFYQNELLDSAMSAMFKITDSTKNMDIISIVGLPIKKGAELYNCAAVIYHGEILALIPKTHLPNYAEYQEQRYFSKSCDFDFIYIKGKKIPIGNKIIFSCKNIENFKFGVEICEDLWVSTPPSNYLSECGANIIANLSASNEIVGKSEYRKQLIKSQSAKLIAAYLYANAGFGESTTDFVFSGQNIIAENGTILNESPLFSSGIIYTEIDLQKIETERRRNNTCKTSCMANEIYFEFQEKDIKLTRTFAKTPFVPSGKTALDNRCLEILSIQSMGLVKRLDHINAKKAVLGLSGGLDSTLALIVMIHAFDKLKLDRLGIIAITMPCFGTSSRTYNNVKKLAKAYSVTLKEISIEDSVVQHFKDISHNRNNHDITYENSQARERTQVLMDIANQQGAIVVGTGDLSELALGWATYNGDHMSMYSVNASIPKTLVRSLIKYEVGLSIGETKEVLEDVLNTPVSPELLPPKQGEISQKTEEIVGPYELHDFFLYYFVRLSFKPEKILRIAEIAFKGVYTRNVIKKWLEVFIKRFFSQQFKRSCMPDGPKVGSVSLSPRGDFRMPSDACVSEWLKALKEN